MRAESWGTFQPCVVRCALLMCRFEVTLDAVSSVRCFAHGICAPAFVLSSPPSVGCLLTYLLSGEPMRSARLFAGAGQLQRSAQQLQRLHLWP